MYWNTKHLCGAVALTAFAACFANAGPLPTDAAAIPAAQGSAIFSGTTGAATLTAKVEYAVYAPGMFSTSAALAFPPDPSGGSDYVYAFEIFNDQGGNARVLNLSVDLAPDQNPTIVTHNPSTPEAGLAPNLSQMIPVVGNPKTNVKWSWTTSLFNVGLHSDILLMTSPFAPHFVLSSMQGGSTTLASASLPSPIPEPGTLVLLGTGLAGLLAVARRRR